MEPSNVIRSCYFPVGTRVFAIVVLFVVLASATSSVCATAADERPNVIFILTDDQNNDTIGCFGGKVLTPNLDRLAREGVRLDRAYAVSSVCTPSRYTCLTGRYAGRCQSDRFLKQCPPDQPSNVGFNVQITPETPNLARALQQSGYTTGFVGKWHTGTPALEKYRRTPTWPILRPPESWPKTRGG